MYSENFVSKKMKTFAQNNDWLISGEYIYGEEQGYLFTGIDGNKVKIFITPVPGITNDQSEDLLSILEKNKVTMQLESYEIVDDFLSIRINDSSSLKPTSIDFILAILAGAMDEISIVAKNRCQECKKLDTEETNFMYDLYCYMHTDCAKIYKDNKEDEEEKEVDSEVEVKEDENDFTEDEPKIERKVLDSTGTSTGKIVGLTALGAFIGSIPWLLLPYIMDFANDMLSKITDSSLAQNFMISLFTCICAYLIVFFAIKGFMIANAPFNGKGRIIVGIVSGLFVILVQFLYLGVLVIKEPNVSLNFSNYIFNLQKFDYYITMLIGGTIGLVFVLINVLPFFESKNKNKKERKQ